MQLFIMCWTPCASVHCPYFSDDTKAQGGLPGTQLREPGHRSGAGHRLLSHSWQLQSLRSWVRPFFTPGTGKSLLETCRHLQTHPVVVEGKGAGVRLGRLTRKDSPWRKADARMPGPGDRGRWRGAWVSEQPPAPISSGQHLPSELWPGAGRTGDQAQPASRWSWGKEGRLGAGTMGPQICPSPKQGRRQGGLLSRASFRACTRQAWRKAVAEPYVWPVSPT